MLNGHVTRPLQVDDGEACQCSRSAPQRSRIDVTRPTSVVRGRMMVAVENELSRHPGKKDIKIFCTWGLNDRRKSITAGSERVMEKGKPVASNGRDDLVRPCRYGWTKLGINLRPRPASIRRELIVNPGRSRLRCLPRAQFVMIAHQQVHARRVQQPIQHLLGKRANPNGITRVKDRLTAHAADRAESRLQRGQVRVRISDDRDLRHVAPLFGANPSSAVRVRGAGTV